MKYIYPTFVLFALSYFIAAFAYGAYIVDNLSNDHVMEFIATDTGQSNP